jgi:hypothetical protein
MPRRAPSDRSYRRGSTRRTSSGVPRIAPDGTRRADEDDDDDDRPLRRRTADRSRRVHIGVRIRSPPPRAWAPADFRRNALTKVLDVLLSSWHEKLRTDFTLVLGKEFWPHMCELTCGSWRLVMEKANGSADMGSFQLGELLRVSHEFLV